MLDKMSSPFEHDYIGLSEKPPISSHSLPEDEKNSVFNMKGTELRLGLPGSESPERVELRLDCLSPLKSSVSGAKRGFFYAIDGIGGGTELGLGSPSHKNGENGQVKDFGGVVTVVPSTPKPVVVKEEKKAQASSFGNHQLGSAPAAKAQVVGWPPIRTFRKNTIASNSGKKDDKSEPRSIYVKVSMDGAPYLRKVDLKTNSNYVELSSALKKMFTCFTIGIKGRDGVSKGHLKDLLNDLEYLLTYEDKDGDWMLVGDVPWEMFVNSCKKIRIMKGSDAIGLAPRASELCKLHS